MLPRLKEICKDENEETGQLQIQILVQMVKKVQKNQPIGKLQKKAESDQDINIEIALLQKQVTNIEVNMIKKINQVLEVISQKKTSIYAEIASKNLPVPQVVITKKPTSQRISQLTSQLTGQAGNPTTVQEKPAEKPREKSAYREKRLILQTSKDFIENLDAKQIRDQVNDAFFKKEGETQLTIVMVTKSQFN